MDEMPIGTPKPVDPFGELKIFAGRASVGPATAAAMMMIAPPRVTTPTASPRP